MKRLSVQRMQPSGHDSKFLIEFNETIGSLDFFGSFFINGKKEQEIKYPKLKHRIVVFERSREALN